ncbi:hypothetical protein DRO26_01300, partial [Candidatus Bathyarchaeota archaeon]
MESIRMLEVGRLQTFPVTVSPSTTISKVIGILRDYDVQEVFVSTEKKVGVVTIKEVLAASNLATKVSSVMIHVPKLSPKDRVNEAAQLMTQYKVKALPIVEDEKIVGKVSARSIVETLKNVRTGLLDLKISSIMTGNPITIDENEFTAKAKNIMVKKKINHLPVTVKGKKLTGMLTSSHIIFCKVPSETQEIGARGFEELGRMSFPVKELMDSDVLTCSPDEKIFSVINRMLNQKRTYSTIVLWEELQGIVTLHDLIKLIVRQEERVEVPFYMVGLPEDPFEAEAAKSKFIKVISLLKKSFPYIEEARSVIKTSTSSGAKERQRYEVDVTIKTPKKLFKFSETGWDLPQIYDLFSNRIKRLITKKHPGRRK